MLFLLLAFPAFSELESRNYCNFYSCVPVGFMPNTTCIYPDILHSTYYLQTCPSSKPHCPLSQNPSQNTSCLKAPVSQTNLTSYPGEACTSNSSCLFGYCLSGVCFGANQNENCKSHSECNPNLRCFAGKCSSLLKAGQSGCDSDFDCDAFSGCNKNSTTGQCVNYFSLGKNARISVCSNMGKERFSLLCSSGVCLSSSSRTSAGICSQAPVSVKNNPKACLYNSECGGYTDEFNYTGTCTCGINKYGSSYCEPFLGDLEGRSYLDALNRFLKKGYAGGCNTARRYSRECWDLYKGTKEYGNLIKSKMLFESYPKLINNENCVKKIFFSDYYEVQVQSFGKWMVANILLATLSL